MSLVQSAPPEEYKISKAELHEVAAANNIKISSPKDEEHYLWLLNSVDLLFRQMLELPAYEEPALKPQGDRKYYRPTSTENPLNAWSHRAEIKGSSCTNGPLAGRSVSMKDNVSVGGLPLTCGTYESLLSGGSFPISQIDATVVPRILEAGATIKGTAVCENFSMAPQSYTSAMGEVQNPWLKGYMCGGSTSGGAALVAINAVREYRKRHGIQTPEDDGLGEGVDMAIGGDQGGSIRIPCSLTGIYGLKPTHGLVPYTGIAPLFPLVDHAGPLATSIPDLALLLSVVAGYDGFDPRMTPETPLREDVKDYNTTLKGWISEKKEKGEWTVSKAGTGLRIGILKEAFAFAHIDQQIKDIMDKAAKRFVEVGAVVEEVSVPLHTMGGAIWTAATRGYMADNAIKNRPPPLLQHPIPGFSLKEPSQEFYDLLTKSNPAVVNALFSTTYLQKYQDPHALAAKAYQHVWQLRAAYDAALKKYDVLILPTTHVVGQKHPDRSDVKTLLAPTIGLTANTASFNATGHPVMVMPVGMGEVPEGRLPVGMQLVAKRWDEETLFKTGMAWEVAGFGLDL